MNKILKSIGLTFSAIALFCIMPLACTEDINSGEKEDVELREVKVSLDLNIQAEESGYGMNPSFTKADGSITKSQTTINKFWLIVYDDKGGLLGEPTYYTSTEDVSLYLPDKIDNLPNEAIIIASTAADGISATTPQFTIDNCKTKADFMALHLLDEGYINNTGSLNADPNLFLYGRFDITKDIQPGATISNIEPLKRNVAKLSFTVKNNANVDAFKIYDILIHNVPEEYSYYASDIPRKFRNYTEILTNDLTRGNQVSYTYYIPQNLQGTSENTEERNKNIYAPSNATYIEVLGKDNSGLYSFKFYPGANMVDDYNIKANHSYNLTIDIVQYTTQNDPRVVNTQVQRLKPSNSYIINPSITSGYDETIYGIPVAWLFKYWNTTDGYATNKVDFTQDENKKLIAEVIWQEQNVRTISFCKEDATMAGDNISFEIDLTDTENYGFFYFKTNGEAPGNILIGVKRESDKDKIDAYLWSWHLWITDYNPDAIANANSAVEKKYIYTIDPSYQYTDGNKPKDAVHRYANNGSDVWHNQYSGKFIMDRNLGAMSATQSDGLKKTRGLYYQYGRKDPFPHYSNNFKKVLYSIDGINGTDYTPSSGDNILIKSSSGTTIDAANNNPYVFYTISGNWISSGSTYNTKNWNNPDNNPVSSYSKGIFDPCPPGWKLPMAEFWSIFSYTNETSFSSNSNTGGINFFIDGSTDSGPTAYYPTTGNRAASDGSTNNLTRGYLYSMSKNTGTSTISLHYDSDVINVNETAFSRAAALPVRCIQENDKE